MDYGYALTWPIVLAAAAIVIVVGVLVAWGVRALERRSRAEQGAERIQALVGEALAREPELRGASILPVASAPVEGRPTLELTGFVASAAGRERAMRVARGELARVRPDMDVVDRLSIVPSLDERRRA